VGQNSTFLQIDLSIFEEMWVKKGDFFKLNTRSVKGDNYTYALKKN